MTFDRKAYHTKYMREIWRPNNVGRAKQISQEANEKYRQLHPKDNVKSHRNNYAKMRNEVIDFFSERCQNPKCAVAGGMTDRRCLQIEHKHGDGYKESSGYGATRRLWILIHSDPKIAKERYQLYCANCNWIKRVQNKEYKHTWEE